MLVDTLTLASPLKTLEYASYCKMFQKKKIQKLPHVAEIANTTQVHCDFNLLKLKDYLFINLITENLFFFPTAYRLLLIFLTWIET